MLDRIQQKGLSEGPFDAFQHDLPYPLFRPPASVCRPASAAPSWTSEVNSSASKPRPTAKSRARVSSRKSERNTRRREAAKRMPSTSRRFWSPTKNKNKGFLLFFSSLFFFSLSPASPYSLVCHLFVVFHTTVGLIQRVSFMWRVLSGIDNTTTNKKKQAGTCLLAEKRRPSV